jgi:hypothetical protein
MRQAGVNGAGCARRPSGPLGPRDCATARELRPARTRHNPPGPVTSPDAVGGRRQNVPQDAANERIAHDRRSTPSMPVLAITAISRVFEAPLEPLAPAPGHSMSACGLRRMWFR